MWLGQRPSPSSQLLLAICVRIKAAFPIAMLLLAIGLLDLLSLWVWCYVWTVFCLLGYFLTWSVIQLLVNNEEPLSSHIHSLVPITNCLRTFVSNASVSAMPSCGFFHTGFAPWMFKTFPVPVLHLFPSIPFTYWKLVEWLILFEKKLFFLCAFLAVILFFKDEEKKACRKLVTDCMCIVLVFYALLNW